MLKIHISRNDLKKIDLNKNNDINDITVFDFDNKELIEFLYTIYLNNKRSVQS